MGRLFCLYTSSPAIPKTPVDSEHHRSQHSMPRKAAGKTGQTRISDAFVVSKKTKSADIKKTISADQSTVQPVVEPVKVAESKAVEVDEQETPIKRESLKPEKAEYKKVLKELTANEISNPSKYWDVRKKEGGGCLMVENRLLTGPVHQHGLSTAEKVLKQFDMRMEYGPTVGITRLDRWKRADRLGMNPPAAVKDILESAEGHEVPRYREAYTAEYL